MITEFIECDQNWSKETTTYWFKLTGIDYGTGVEFDGTIYGAVESGCDDVFIIDTDGCQMTSGDNITTAVMNNIEITDKMRSDT